MTDAQILAKWFSLNAAQRTAILLTDKSMRHPSWKGLVSSLSTRVTLTALQSEMLLAAPTATSFPTKNPTNSENQPFKNQRSPKSPPQDRARQQPLQIPKGEEVNKFLSAELVHFTTSDYWRKFRQGRRERGKFGRKAGPGYYSRRKRNNDIRFGARMNFSGRRVLSGLFNKFRRLQKGAIRRQRLDLEHFEAQQAKLRKEIHG